MKTHDVIVIGGSLAGAACAIELRRRGIDVAVLDRDRFPRPKVCGGFLSPGAVASLEALGVVDRVWAGGARAVDRVRLSNGGRRIDIPLSRPGIGCSREILDTILAREACVAERHSVTRVDRRGDAGDFVVEVRTPGGSSEHIAARMVIDAAGRFSRFTPGVSGTEFGVQFSETRDLGRTLEFGFFEWGYGGTVSVGDGVANSCFLVGKSGLGRFLDRGDCQVTGPVVYDRKPGPYLSIGDAAGMVDPFSGEGMHHALESGRLAASVVSDGFDRRWSDRAIRAAFDTRHRRAWAGKRRTGALLRWFVRHPTLGRRLWSSTKIPGVPTLLLEKLWSSPRVGRHGSGPEVTSLDTRNVNEKNGASRAGNVR